jgi:hypothetical protein
MLIQFEPKGKGEKLYLGLGKVFLLAIRLSRSIPKFKFLNRMGPPG